MQTPSVNTAGIDFVRDHLAHFPRPDQQAARAIRQWASQRNLDLDPQQVEVVTLHYRPDGAAGYQAVIVQRMTLTQAMLQDWQGESNINFIGALFNAPWAGHFPDGPLRIVDQLPAQGALEPGISHQVFNGLFRRTQPARYDASTHLRLPAEDFQRFVWNQDFHSQYTTLLQQYWDQHSDSHRLALKINFIAACNRQVAQGSLSDAGRRLAWQAANLQQRDPSFRVSPLNVYGYAASDLLCLHSGEGPVVLYLPGNSSPLHEFDSEAAMKDWFAAQCKSRDGRAALARSFALADGPDGLDFSGVDTALEGLGEYPAVHRLPPRRSGLTTDGRWSPLEYVNYRPQRYSPPLEGDLFRCMTERQRQRSLADADFLITSNSEITKAKWRGYLLSSIDLLAPLALVVPELAPIFAVAGMAQFGLGLDQAITARTQAQRAQGVEDIVYGLFNATPLALEVAAKSKAIFSVASENFVFPSLVNERWGYPMSPVSPPRLPDLDVAPYFTRPNTVAPLPDADPAIAASVIRLTAFDGSADTLQASIETYSTSVVYDLEQDAFVREDSLNDVLPQYYIARTGSFDLVRVDPDTRTVTHAMRSASLRALGIDLQIPVDLPAVQLEGASPIPQTLSCLWVGDRAIPADLLDNLGRNAQRLDASQYQMRLYLSEANTTVFEENMRLLGEQAPALTVLPLERQPFFQRFRQSKYHAHYQAALDGNGGVASNFASAADVLRYRLLFEEGGLYMDVDDRLLMPGEYPYVVDGQSIGMPGEAIDQLALVTRPDGLLLPPPMSNQNMGMQCLYNTSFIGSHPANPTLEAISEEIHTRFLASPRFYDSRPRLADDPQGFNRYARQLSALTGPQVFTDIVDRRLPELYLLRQLLNLRALQAMNVVPFVDQARMTQLVQHRLPLNRLAKTGGFHSWARP
ncbi:TPA: DUF6543 domain-containing protein [Pseudomonas putida]